MNCAIYARVSTKDQECEIQLTYLRAFVERRGWNVTEYVEKRSGKEANWRRPQLERLLEDARMRRIDVVVVWKLDRFGRSALDTLPNIKALDFYKVRFLCPSVNIDTGEHSPVGRFTVTLLAAVAELARDFIRERTQLGLTAYREAYNAGQIGKTRHSTSGKDLPIGRPRKIFDRRKLVSLRNQGRSVRQIAVALGVPRTTVARYLQKAA